MVEFTEAQAAQLLAWSAQGETPSSMLVRIADENRDNAAPAWPETSESDIEHLLGEQHNRRIAAFARRLMTRLDAGGLAGRSAQAAACIDRMHELDREIRAASAQFARLMQSGAYDLSPFISETVLDHANAVYAEQFGRAPRGRDGGSAVIIVREGGERYRIETSAIVVGNALLARANALGKLLIGLRLARTKEAELLSKISGASQQKDLVALERIELR